jgi:hypothetical protein
MSFETGMLLFLVEILLFQIGSFLLQTEMMSFETGIVLFLVGMRLEVLKSFLQVEDLSSDRPHTIFQ